jgi:predicted nucleic acid-binding protein
MTESVYVETTVISYLTARPSRDLLVAGHQQVTRQWWDERRRDFKLVASQLVAQESAAGDAEAARERTKAFEEIELLEAGAAALGLARKLIEKGAIPEQAGADALHIALAVTNGITYLLTWNLKHIANAAVRSRIEKVCREEGYEPTVICTPEELLEE